MRTDRFFVLLAVPFTLLGSSCSSAGPAASGAGGPVRVDTFGRSLVDVCPESARAPGDARCYVKRVVTDAIVPLGLPPGLRGDQVATAYNIPTSSASGGAIIALVDAGGDSTVLADLQTYRKQFGLPAMSACSGLPVTGGSPCLAVVNQTGGSKLPGSQGWEGEIALDTQIASAACPDCSIVLVEANTQNNADLDAAVDYAAKVPGVVAVSNSYGWPETGGGTPFSTADDSHYDHPGVLILASSGDSDFHDEGQGGTGPSFPASSVHVIAVGGTMLAVDTTSTRGYSETVWNVGGGEGTGSGCSSHFAQPSYQAGLSAACKTHRITNDLSAAADFKGGGVLEYCSASTYACGSIGWSQVVGTSVSAPMVAGFFARLKLAGTIAADPSFIYTNASGFYDVTVGKNAPTCKTKLCKAGVGWDGPTGVGTPNGAVLAGL